ncbi:unnamed protein product [Echinostoma caproni]|uniref:AIP3 domain-containing protein n=1 Tax=Echinostoma caproni TaxID=27848 RepID=A0A183AGL7_9TREM|nr:unnamed protein product [Echinostoma caproni]
MLVIHHNNNFTFFFSSYLFSAIVSNLPEAAIYSKMPVAVCSPTDSRPLPQYASSPATRSQTPLCHPISLSALMNSHDGLDLCGMVPPDEMDETTFSELVPSITEQVTSSPNGSGLGDRQSTNELPNGSCASPNESLQPPSSQNGHILLESLDDGDRPWPTPLVDPSSECLEWDDSGHLRGLPETRSGSIESRFDRFSLPLADGHSSHRGARSGSGATILSGLEQIPADRSHRSSFTLAAEAAEALVASGSGRHGTRHLSYSSSTGNKLTSDYTPEKALLPRNLDRPIAHSHNLIAKKDTRLINSVNVTSIIESAKFEGNLLTENKMPVCCSTPAQRVSNGRIHKHSNGFHRSTESENVWPTLSESPTIPIRRIRQTNVAPSGSPGCTTAVTIPTLLNQQSHPISTGSTETMHSLFSNAPVNGMISQTNTSRSLGDLVGSMNDSSYLDSDVIGRKFEECDENPVIQLGLIRSQDAVPLLGLLDRLEQGCPHPGESCDSSKPPVETSTQDLERERVQLDIDRSFLQFYTKELTNWKELADSFRHSTGSSRPCGQHSTDSYTIQTQLAIDAFCDWLSALQNRLAVCLNHLNRRALWIDQMNGFTHELKSSFAVVEERVRNSLQQTRSLLLAWCPRPDPVHPPSEGIDEHTQPENSNRNQIVETLNDLQNLSDSVLAFQVRLGSCHLVNDCWSSNDMFQPVPCALRQTADSTSGLGDGQHISGAASFTSSFSSFLDSDSDTEPSSESADLHVVTERAERLQRRLRVAIRRLQQAIVTSTGSNSIPKSACVDLSPFCEPPTNAHHCLNYTVRLPSRSRPYRDWTMPGPVQMLLLD